MIKALSRSDRQQDRLQSISILNNFLESRVYVSEALYCLATVYYSMHNYEKARNYVEEMLMQNPDNKQVVVDISHKRFHMISTIHFRLSSYTEPFYINMIGSVGNHKTLF